MIPMTMITTIMMLIMVVIRVQQLSKIIILMMLLIVIIIAMTWIIYKCNDSGHDDNGKDQRYRNTG